MILPVVLVSTALAAPADLLAPSIADLDRSLDRLQSALRSARDVDGRWSKLQEAWVTTECAVWACSSSIGAAQVVRLRAAARAGRRFAQAARAEASRTDRIRSFDAVGPLIQGARRRRVRRLLRELDLISRRFATRLAWNARFVERWAAGHAGAIRTISCEPDR